MEIWDMEEGEVVLSREREAKGQNINICNAKKKSNGNRRRGEKTTLIDIVIRLRI
jgi:hypothetical protein